MAKRYIRRPKREFVICRMITKMYPDETSIRGGYYSWLQSPKEAELQLDMYLPELHSDAGIGVAIEVQGKQHTQFVKSIHRTKAAFNYLQRCDKIKKRLLKKKGIALIEVFHNERISYELLEKKFKEIGAKDPCQIKE